MHAVSLRATGTADVDEPSEGKTDNPCPNPASGTTSEGSPGLALEMDADEHMKRRQSRYAFWNAPRAVRIRSTFCGNLALAKDREIRSNADCRFSTDC